MVNSSYFSGLTCTSCGEKYNHHQILAYCKRCLAPLFANYDLEGAKENLDRDALSSRQKGMWRWFELLPVFDHEHIISLGEGDTPLLQLNTVGRQLGFPNLFIKEEGSNPTGSFKARGISAAVSKAVELGVQKIVMPSAGNAGGALAAYAARAAVQSLIFMPKSSPIANITECQIMGADVRLIDGLIDDAGKLAHEFELSEGWFNLSTFREPYRVEGKKIMGYEIAESLDWKLPDVIIYPTGGGTGLVGMWKAFLELETLGWLEQKQMPKMIAVQSEGCAPIVKAFNGNQEHSIPWENAHTIATGLCVPQSFADKLILKFIRDSSGIAISVTDQEILNCKDRLARNEGIFACPEGAATLAGLYKLLDNQTLDSDQTIVLFNTGTGLKYIA